MGTNRRYGSPRERAEVQRLRRQMISPEGRRRVRHCWVQTRSAAEFDEPQAPGLIVEWSLDRSNGVWHARVVYVPDRGTVVDAWFPYTWLTPVTSGAV